MFDINKTFTKYDLINIADNLDLDIVYSTNDNKNQIKIKIKDCIQKNLKNILNPNDYNLSTYHDLYLYLKNTNPNKRLSSKERETIINISKKIINYCKNDYNLQGSCYDSKQDIIDDLYTIKKSGDILSVRKALELWNVQVNEIKFNPIISVKKKKILEEKRRIKNLNSKLIIKREKIILTFD